MADENQQTGEQSNLKNIMVATDGSECSKKAFRLALQFFEDDIFQQVIVTHVSNSEKTYLASHYRPESIYSEYKTQLLSLYPSSKYKLIFEEKRQEYESCRDQILQIAKNMNVSLLFIGYSGRKGEKEEATIMAQTVKFCAFHSKVPLFITKRESKRKEQKSGGFTFLACVDGSQKGWRCLDLALKLAYKPQDKVIVAYAPTPDRAGYELTIKQQVHDELEGKSKIAWEILILKPSYDAGGNLVQYVNLSESNHINFVILGNNGYRAQQEGESFFGRTAEKIVTSAKANPIVLSQD